MPAIRYTSAPHRLEVVNQYALSGVRYLIWLKGADKEFIISRCVGFICVAGSNHFAGARLGKLLVRDISNGDGGVTSAWRTVPPNEYVYAIVLPGEEMPITYVITGDDGWPITTIDEFRSFQKCPQLMPSSPKPALTKY